MGFGNWPVDDDDDEWLPLISPAVRFYVYYSFISSGALVFFPPNARAPFYFRLVLSTYTQRWRDHAVAIPLFCFENRVIRIRMVQELDTIDQIVQSTVPRKFALLLAVKGPGGGDGHHYTTVGSTPGPCLRHLITLTDGNLLLFSLLFCFSPALFISSQQQ